MYAAFYLQSHNASLCILFMKNLELMTLQKDKNWCESQFTA